MNTLFWTFFPFMAIYFAESFGKGTAGALLVGSQVIAVIANLFGGYSADRFGRKRMMVFSAYGQGIAFVLFAWANSPWLDSPLLTFICFSALGVFGSFYWPASHAMVADVVEEKDRSQVFAVFYTAINIAVVIGPVIGSIFFFQYRFELLLMAAFISFVLAVVLTKFLRETAPLSDNRPMLEGKENMSWHEVLAAQLKDYKVILTDKTFMLFIVAGILAAQTFMQMDLLMAVYTTEFVDRQTLFAIGNWELVMSGEKAFGFIIAENGLLVALFTVVMTKFITRFKERYVFMTSSMTYGVAILLFGSSANIWILFIAMAIFTMGELMVVGIQESFVARLAPEHMRGQYFAASSLRFTIGRTIAPMSIPLTMWVGYDWTFFILFLLAVLSSLFYFIMFKRMDKQGPITTQPDHQL